MNIYTYIPRILFTVSCRWIIGLVRFGQHLVYPTPPSISICDMPTFVLPGLGGWGDMTMGRPSYFELGERSTVLDTVGFARISVQANNAVEQIRRQYPTLSPTNPIHLVGHSMGAQSIMEIVTIEGMAGCIRSITLVSPCLKGFHRQTTLVNPQTLQLRGLLSRILTPLLRLITGSSFEREATGFSGRYTVMEDFGEPICTARTLHGLKIIARLGIPVLHLSTVRSMPVTVWGHTMHLPSFLRLCAQAHTLW